MEAENITIKKKSQTKDILRRFFKNKAAVFGLIVILLLILCALFPQVIAPYSYDKQNLKEHFLRREQRTAAAPMISAATSSAVLCTAQEFL